MKKKVLLGLAGLVVVLVVLQLIPIEMTNPPANGALTMPTGDTGQALEAACMDCHSNETVWPWYSRVAPARFLIADHVNEGRSHLNFSTWGQRTPERQAEKWEEIAELAQEGEMPLWSYTLMHPAARLTDAQRQLIADWANAERARLEASGVVPPSEGDEGTAQGEREGEESGEREEGSERGERGQR